MLEFLKKNQLNLAIVSLLVTFFFIYMYQTRNRIENWFGNTIQIIAYPLQELSHSISLGIGGLWTNYIWLIGVEEENGILKDEIKALKQKNNEYIEINQSFKRLVHSLEYKKSSKNKMVFADIIAEANQGYSKALIINKGSSDGILSNFAVLTPEGVVGKIQSTSIFQSRVQLITDSRSKFPVRIQRTRDKGILEGSPEGSLRVSFLQRRANLRINDRIITSGLSGIFPKGTFVGTVEGYDKKDFGLFQEAKIIPAVNFSKIEEVFVIIKSEENIHQPLFTK